MLTGVSEEFTASIIREIIWKTQKEIDLRELGCYVGSWQMALA
jgi:hypothetical protein